jgi:CD80-like C2-set immunoglobulin domain
MSMIADRKYELMCESVGSRPDASIYWLKGRKPLKKSREVVTSNSTVSTLMYTPTTEDDGKTITCRAENPKVTGLFLETTWTMSVYCRFHWPSLVIYGR